MYLSCVCFEHADASRSDEAYIALIVLLALSSLLSIAAVVLTVIFMVAISNSPRPSAAVPVSGEKQHPLGILIKLFECSVSWRWSRINTFVKKIVKLAEFIPLFTVYSQYWLVYYAPSSLPITQIANWPDCQIGQPICKMHCTICKLSRKLSNLQIVPKLHFTTGKSILSADSNPTTCPGYICKSL